MTMMLYDGLAKQMKANWVVLVVRGGIRCVRGCGNVFNDRNGSGLVVRRTQPHWELWSASNGICVIPIFYTLLTIKGLLKSFLPSPN